MLQTPNNNPDNPDNRMVDADAQPGHDPDAHARSVLRSAPRNTGMSLRLSGPSGVPGPGCRTGGSHDPRVRIELHAGDLERPGRHAAPVPRRGRARRRAGAGSDLDEYVALGFAPTEDAARKRIRRGQIDDTDVDKRGRRYFVRVPTVNRRPCLNPRPCRVRALRNADGSWRYYATYATRERCEARVLELLLPGGDAIFGARVSYGQRMVATSSGRSSGEWMPWNRDPELAAARSLGSGLDRWSLRTDRESDHVMTTQATQPQAQRTNPSQLARREVCDRACTRASLPMGLQVFEGQSGSPTGASGRSGWKRPRGRDRRPERTAGPQSRGTKEHGQHRPDVGPNSRTPTSTTSSPARSCPPTTADGAARARWKWGETASTATSVRSWATAATADTDRP